jgi:hypothetical protein
LPSEIAAEANYHSPCETLAATVNRRPGIALLCVTFVVPLFVCQTTALGANDSKSAVTLTPAFSSGINAHPKSKSAIISFRIQNDNKVSLEIRDLGANVQNLILVRPTNWSAPLTIAPGESVPVKVTYKASNCRKVPNTSLPMHVQMRTSNSAWRSAGIRLTAVNGPGRWERSVLSAACVVRVRVHG